MEHLWIVITPFWLSTDDVSIGKGYCLCHEIGPMPCWVLAGDAKQKSIKYWISFKIYQSAHDNFSFYVFLASLLFMLVWTDPGIGIGIGMDFILPGH